MKSLLLLVAVFTLAYGQEVTLNRNDDPQEIPIVANEGNNVTFRCVIPSVSIVVSVRLPGSSAFGTGIPANVIREGNTGEVTITVVNAQRSENLLSFQCAGGGLSTDIGILTVYYAPNYTNPGNQMFTEGMNAVVTVPLDANPIPDFTWTRDNMPVSATNVDLNASTIVFNPAMRENTGTYTIFGNNSAGSNSTTFEVVVNYVPAFDVGTGNLNCSGSSPITCAIGTGADGTFLCSGTGSPPPTVTSTIDASTTNNVQFTNNKFIITGAVAGNAGTYSCNASNSVGSDVRTFRLWVGGTPTLSALTFSVNDTHVVIMWTFNDMGVPVSSFIVTIDCGGQPIVNNITVPMMGNQVTSTQALASFPADTSCTVTVHSSNLLGSSNSLTNTFMTPAGDVPVFDVGTGNLNCIGSNPITCAIRTGADGTLQCSATGSPPPTVTDTRDPSTASTVEFMNNQFTITGADATTAGTYSCNASNNVGSDVRTFYLMVGGTPTLNALTFSVNDTHVVIMWTFNDMGVPVSPFMVTIDCGGQPILDNVTVPMMGNEVTLTRALATYPADTSCTVTVRTSNLLGSSNTLENMFMTRTGNSTSQTPATSGGAAFSAAIFSVLLLMIASLVF